MKYLQVQEIKRRNILYRILLEIRVYIEKQKIKKIKSTFISTREYLKVE